MRSTLVDTISVTMNKGQQREAAELLRRVVERIDQGEVAAPGWLRERLVGAMLALDSQQVEVSRD